MTEPYAWSLTVDEKTKSQGDVGDPWSCGTEGKRLLDEGDVNIMVQNNL
jgi:hypothetical protein